MNLSEATSISLGSSPISSLFYGALKIWPPINWQQLGQNILGQASNNQLGSAVAMSGDGTRVAVSAPYYGNGAVYVLDWNEAAEDWKTPGWQTYGFYPQATGGQSITIPNSSAFTNTQFGTSLALSRDGSTLAVGSGSGAVVVCRQSGENWAAIGEPLFQASGNPSTSQAKFGYSISLNANGSRVAVGVPDGTGYSGYVTAYEFNGTAWVQMGENIASLDTGDKTGFSVAMNDEGNRIVIGARYGSTNSRGTARVVSWNGGMWSLISGSAIIDGTANNDESGYTVAMNSAGNYLAIGARYHDQPASNAGQVRVFYADETGQPHQVGSSINGTASDDFSGASISLNAAGNIVAIGSELGDATGKANCGHVRVFKFTKDDPEAWSVSGLTQGTWSQVGSTLVGLAADDAFFTVSLNSAGTRLIVGGKFNDTNAANAGCARVFKLTE
jgi:hypothetical protein